MEIKPKIEENIPVQGNNIQIPENNRFKNTGNSSIKSDMPDFEAYLKELDEDKKTKEVQQNNLQISIPQSEKAEALKSLKKLATKDQVPVRIRKLDDKNLFMRTKELSKTDKLKIDLDNFKKEDIDFLRVCLENPSAAINNLNPQTLQANIAIPSQDGQVSYKSFNVSKSLFNLIEYSFKAQKPVRLDFNGDSSVILKMNNSGKLTAEFISNDKAMEYLLKSSIPGLRDKLDSEGIPYEEISYKDNSRNNKRQNKGGNQ